MSQKLKFHLKFYHHLITSINNISFNIGHLLPQTQIHVLPSKNDKITKLLFYAEKNRVKNSNFYHLTFFQSIRTSSSKLRSKLFVTYRSPHIDTILNILLYHVLASKESKRARCVHSETSARADGWKWLQLDSPWNNPIFRVYHCSFLRSDPTSKWMHNDISHLLVEMERFYSLENAIFPWKEGEQGGGGGGKGDTRHIQHGNTLTNAFDNVSGKGGEEGRTIVFKILLFSRSPVFRTRLYHVSYPL